MHQDKTQFNSAPCLCCGGTLAADARLAGLLRCTGCGFVTADSNLDGAQLAALYGPDYFHGAEYGDYQADKRSLQHNFSQRLTTLLKFVTDPKAKSLFEIGCAYGFFLETAAPHFAKVAGMDVDAAVVGTARQSGLDVQAGDFLTTETGAHDVYTLWDTIEHLGQPDRFIAKIARDIRPGGVVAITTGDMGSLNARMRGRKWRMIHPPTHLHYFSRATLTKLLAAHGFEIVHVEHPGHARSVRAILHGILVLTLGWPRLYRALEWMVPAKLTVSLNLRDIMFVIARRAA